MERLITIGDLSKKLKLLDPKTQKPLNYILRYWEKKFKQIKPKILNGNRRYYDEKNIKLLKKIHFLLKEQGMTINGVKKILDTSEPLKLDENKNKSINPIEIRNKLKKISNLIKNLK